LALTKKKQNSKVGETAALCALCDKNYQQKYHYHVKKNKKIGWCIFK